MAHKQKLNVGIAVDTVTGYGRQILRGVLQYASLRHRWMVIKEFLVLQTDPDAWPSCNGVIITTGNPVLLAKFQQRFQNVVSCSGAADPAICPVVAMDDKAVGRLAAAHLMDCRLRHFAYYGVPDHVTSTNRLNGFREVLAAKGFACSAAPFRYVWERPLKSGWREHWPNLQRWLRSLAKPVGILAMDDMAADDLAAACHDAGITIPDQVALIGVNNDDLLCESAWPPLSSVQADYERVGYTAARILERLMAGEALSPDERMMRLPPVGVVCRTSTDVLAVDEPNVAAAVRFIREHACDPCSVGDVLREVPVARRWLEKQFVHKLGRTPHQEINQVRIDRARRLLLKPDLTIEQIAESCGFLAVQSFNRAFRSVTGESPGAFRRARLVRIRE